MDSRIRIVLKIIDERGGTLKMNSKEIGSLLGLGLPGFFRRRRKSREMVLSAFSFFDHFCGTFVAGHD